MDLRYRRNLSKEDEPRIQKWMGCRVVLVCCDGAVWIEGPPFTGHWLRDDHVESYLVWRKKHLGF